MVDNRFCIRVCGYATAVFRSQLLSDEHEIEWDPSVLWMAPEVTDDNKHMGSKAADIFSLGLIIVELLNRDRILFAFEDPENARSKLC